MPAITTIVDVMITRPMICLLSSAPAIAATAAGATAETVRPAPMPRAARVIAAVNGGDRFATGPPPTTAGAIPRRSRRRRSRSRPRETRLCTVPTGQRSSAAACW